MNLKKALAVSLFTAAFFLATIPAHADQDAVQFGSNIHVASGSTVHDAVCFFCNVNAEGEVKGNVVVFFGDVHLSGKADHDVVNFFGAVRAEDNAAIGNNLVNFCGAVRLGENVSVGHDMVAMLSSVHAPESVVVGNNRVVQPAWIVVFPLVLFAFVIFFVVRELRMWAHRRMMRHYPFPPAQ
jgi:hypothetical protein